MIVVAGQREWVKEAWKEAKLGRYVGSIDEILQLKKGSRIFFVHWSDIVPKDVLDDYVCIGFHMTDLTFGRGGSPLQNLIVLGHKETVLTAFCMTEEIDYGPIYMQNRLDLEGTAHEIYRRTARMALTMAQQIIRDNTQPTPHPYAVENTSKFQRRKPHQSYFESLQYHNEKSAYDFIRMLDAPGYPHASVGGATWKIEFTDAQINADGQLTAKATFKWQKP